MDDERLIVEVEQHKIIYDTTDPFYKDQGRKDKAWNLIAGVLGVDADTCKMRWRVLRDTFVKNIKKSLTSGSAGGTQKKWKYAEIMSFIVPHIQPRSSKSNWSQSHTDEEWSIIPGSEDRPSTPGISSQQPCTSPAPSTSAPSTSRSRSPRDRTSARAVAAQAPWETRRGRRACADNGERLLEPPVPKPHIPDGELDEAYHFALSIVPVLHRLNKDRRQQAKIEILTVLHDHERGQAEQATVQKQPSP